MELRRKKARRRQLRSKGHTWPSVSLGQYMKGTPCFLVLAGDICPFIRDPRLECRCFCSPVDIANKCNRKRYKACQQESYETYNTRREESCKSCIVLGPGTAPCVLRGCPVRHTTNIAHYKHSSLTGAIGKVLRFFCRSKRAGLVSRCSAHTSPHQS